MASIVVGGIIATVAVIVIGVAVALPPFLQPAKGSPVLLAINIANDDNMPTWCEELSRILVEEKIDAVVFFAGEIAERYPQCVTSFGSDIDIGSSTYNYTRLPELTDYSEQLSDVKKGKQAVDVTGNLESKSFRAPYGSTDENIYSLLSRSGILADFSYHDRYHKYHEGQFIWFEITVYDAQTTSEEYLRGRIDEKSQKPIEINIDNSVSIVKVRGIIGALKEGGANFLSASELTGIPLTIRGGN